LIRYEDLAGFQAEEARAPDRLPGLRHLQTPPNSGGIVMLIALNILEGFDLKKLGHNTPQYLHVLTEASNWRRRPYPYMPTRVRARRAHPAVALKTIRSLAARADQDGSGHFGRAPPGSTRGQSDSDGP